MKRKILIMGLPGAGRTTLANTLAPLLNAVVFNADAVRANLSRDLSFSRDDRVEHARRMGWMCDRVVEAGGTVIADLARPTTETRAAFGEAFTIGSIESKKAVSKIRTACSWRRIALTCGSRRRAPRTIGLSTL
jgi:adenylylsulfate kinase-like enzyme